MEHNWVHSSSYAALPPYAVVGGHDSDGSPIYVGRAFHEGENMPAKVIPSKGFAFVAWGGSEHIKSTYEVLVGQGYAWVPCYGGGSVPPKAVYSGTTTSGEPLYVGRGHHANSLTVGKIHPSHGCLYIPFGGQEVRVDTYEVLIYERHDYWAPPQPPSYVPPPPSYVTPPIYVGQPPHQDYKWIHSSAYASIPPNAVPGGNDTDGDTLYVGRAFHNGDMLVAKVVPSKQIAFVSLKGEEIPKTHFEILTGENLIWQHCYDHIIPENAVICGNTALGQPVYIGRGHYEGCLTVGKVSSVHRALFIPWCGVERRLESYEVLVAIEKREPGWSLPVATEESFPAPPPPISPPIEKVEIEELHVQPQHAAYPPATETKKIYPYPPEFLKPYPYPIEDAKPFPPSQIAVSVCPPAYTPMPQPQLLSPPTFGTAPPYVSPAETFCPPPPPYEHVPPMNKPPRFGMPLIGMVPSSPAPAPPPPPALAMQQQRAYDVWVNSNSSYSPPNAVYAGHDTDSSPIYVCRAFHRGDLIPGKAMPSRGVAYISFAGEEVSKPDFEVLVGQGYHWVHASNGIVPPAAVAAGRTSSGEPLYVGRASYCGSLTPGKVQGSHRCLYIAFGGRERRVENYEVLVRKHDFYREQSMKMHY